MKRVFFTFSLLTLLIRCDVQDRKRNIEAYYFPIDALKEGKVYVYQPVGNPHDPPMYWFYKTLEENGQQYLLAMSYDPAFSPDQFVREERASNGMLLAGMFMYEADSTGKKVPLETNIEAANVFPFFVKNPAGVLLTSIHYQPLSDTASISLVKNRQFEKDTAFTFGERELPAVKFVTRELVDQETEGHLELEYGGMEVYAKGIGLVYFRKDISKNWQMTYRLTNIYDLKEFEEKYKIALSMQEKG